MAKMMKNGVLVLWLVEGHLNELEFDAALLEIGLVVNRLSADRVDERSRLELRCNVDHPIRSTQRRTPDARVQELRVHLQKSMNARDQIKI